MRAVLAEHGCFSAGRHPLWLRWVACLAVATAVLAGLSGCGGCRKSPAQIAKEKKEREKRLAEERAKRKKKKKKPDFEISRLATRPPSPRLNMRRTDPARAGSWYKPGHWTATTLKAKTNNFDFLGDLTLSAVDIRGDAIPLVAAPFELSTSRQIALPKRQPKMFESVLFVPPARRSASVSLRLTDRKGGRRGPSTSHRLSRMPSYQYHFVVLARWPERYGYLRGLASVKPPTDEFSGERNDAYYLVSMVTGSRRLELPSHGLSWTSTAYLLWDDVEPTALDELQQTAMLDWLHWGGQLIVSGPDTLDTLRDSFLASYLPAVAGGVRELTQEDFAELNSWSGKTIRPLAPRRPWTGVQLQKHPEARFVPGSGGLMAERRVGRGRIVVSAFRLSGRELTSWPGWDEVVNAFLLGRRPRRFVGGDQGELLVGWADDPGGIRRFDAARVCNLRYFSRDAGVKYGSYAADVQRGDDQSYDEGPPPGPGVAAWNDFNPVAREARKSLLKAACIEIPNRMFVVWVVAGYLLVLVPANWAVFRVLDRVEWAWAAAPLIAVACTATVVKMAQLNIGFARSRTEIAVVELQGDYSRAHLTRYSALYTSLEAPYQFRLEEPGAVLLPFPTVTRAQAFRNPRGTKRRALRFLHGKDACMEGFAISSNSTGLIHGEQMVELGGSLALIETPGGGGKVANRTVLCLQGAAVVRKTAAGNLETAWLGTLEPGDVVPMKWTRQAAKNTGGKLWSRHRDDSLITEEEPRPGELNLRRLIELAQDPGPLQPGQARLLAWLTDEIPGLSIKPAAAQRQFAAVVVAQLCHGPGTDPRPDENTREEVEKLLDRP